MSDSGFDITYRNMPRREDGAYLIAFGYKGGACSYAWIKSKDEDMSDQESEKKIEGLDKVSIRDLTAQLDRLNQRDPKPPWFKVSVDMNGILLAIVVGWLIIHHWHHDSATECYKVTEIGRVIGGGE